MKIDSSKTHAHLIQLQNKIQFKENVQFSKVNYSETQKKIFKKSHETYVKYTSKG